MSGRSDYYERKEKKKEIYQERADKARRNSNQHHKNHERIANMIPMGQPILVDHYSANRHRRDIDKMNNEIGKAIKEDEKAEYYERKLESIEENTSISSDDPKAIEKLEKKIEQLEKQKAEIKSREHAWYELPYVNKEIKRIKNRIQELKELEEIDFKEIVFNEGKVIHNKEINRIQIIFDNIPDEETRDFLKYKGFKWSRTQGAWQRLFNKNGIYAAKRVVEKIDNK